LALVPSAAPPHGRRLLLLRTVSYRSFPVRAAITTPVEPLIADLVHYTSGVGLPRYCGESASTLVVSRPARCSLALRPARTADPLKGPFPEVLQTIRFLLIRLRCFRLERELAGPDFHRGEPYTFFKTHTITLPKALFAASLSAGTTGSSLGVIMVVLPPRSFAALQHRVSGSASLPSLG